MTQPGTDSTSEAGDYGLRLRRRWWAVVLGLALGVGGALAFTASQQQRFSSTTSILVLATPVSAPGSTTTTTRGDIVMETEAELVQSAQVAEAARGLLGTAATAGRLLNNVTVTVPSNSQVLAIAYSDRTAGSAQAGAQAFAQAYLGFRTGNAQSQIQASLTGVTNDLATASTELRAATDRIATLPPTSLDYQAAVAQRGILQSRISTLEARRLALAATPATAGQVITQAPLPTKPSYPVPGINLAAGAVLGLLVGLALAVLVDRLDTTLRHPSDVQRRVGLPVLAEPAQRGRRRSAGAGADAALFDRFRNTLAGPADRVHLLQVSDPGERGASGLVALRLAESFVRSQDAATLVLAHSASPVAQWAGLSGRPGLSDLLLGTASATEVVHTVPSLPGVLVVPPGRDPDQLEALLQSGTARSGLAPVLSSSPVVVVETAGTGESAAAQAVAAMSDTLVLVAERGVADDALLRTAADGAAQMGATVAGVVLAPRGAQSRGTALAVASEGSEPVTPARPASDTTDAAESPAVTALPTRRS